jgi:hypothetical protein
MHRIVELVRRKSRAFKEMDMEDEETTALEAVTRQQVTTQHIEKISCIMH